MGLEDILQSGWGCDSSCLSMAHQALGIEKFLAQGWAKLLFQDQESCKNALPESSRPASCQVPSQVVPLAWYCRWTKFLGGITSWVLQVWTQPDKIHLLVVASSSILFCPIQILWWLSPTDSLAIPLWQSKSRGSHKVSHNDWAVRCPLWVLFSHWRNWWLREYLSL